MIYPICFQKDFRMDKPVAVIICYLSQNLAVVPNENKL